MMMGGMLLFPLLIIAIIAYLIGWRPDFGQRPSERAPGGERPVEILKRRYARGEIRKDEYEEMLRDLE
jgi:uncharacterized membrane protein